MQRAPLGEIAMETSNNTANTTGNEMAQLLQSCTALHAVSSNNSPPNGFNVQNGSTPNNANLVALQPRKLQPNQQEANNNSHDVNDENLTPLGSRTQNTNNNNNNKMELRADLTQLAALRRNRAPTMSRRNERERNRVRYLNFTFDVLRQHLPRERAKGKAKKMSKVDTLHGAIDYIRDLQNVLGLEDTSPPTTPSGSSGALPTGFPESEADSLSPRGSPEGCYTGGESPGEAGGAASEILSDQQEEDQLHNLAGWFC